MKKQMQKHLTRLGWGLIITVIVVAINEMFFYRILSNNIHFLKLTHYENRSDILNVINIVASIIINVSIYKLSKQIEEKNEKENDRKRYESICIVYDYLIEVVTDIKKQVFKEKEDYHKLKYKKEFIKEVYNLNGDIFDESDIELLRRIDATLNNYFNHKEDGGSPELAIKWLYKNIFDLCVKIEDIDEMNNLVDNDLLLNVQLVEILSKLKKELNYDYKKDVKYGSLELIISEDKDDIVVNKSYKDKKVIKNGKGNVKIFEPIFYRNGECPHRNGGLVYDGDILNYQKNGRGTYYYYKSEPEKGTYINSDDLIDENAKKIKKILINNDIDTRINLSVQGKFTNGSIKSGCIKFEGQYFQDIIIES